MLTDYLNRPLQIENSGKTTSGGAERRADKGPADRREGPTQWSRDGHQLWGGTKTDKCTTRFTSH